MMNRLWKNIILAMVLLAGSAFAGFIQSPIPPSSHENFLYDRDGDGRLDQMTVKFLGAVSREYLDQMVDSLTFDWADSSGALIHETFAGKDLEKDSSSNRVIKVDLNTLQHQFIRLTALRSPLHSWGSLGNVHVFLADGTVYKVSMKDKMAPVAVRSDMRYYRGRSADTLTIHFSESVVANCDVFLDYKSAKDSVIRVLPPSKVEWNFGRTSANVIFDENLAVEERLVPKDSIRILQGCVSDSLKNISSDSAFIFVRGYYPLDIYSSPMVVDEQRSEDNLPIFSLLFEEEGSDFPNENAWGIAMDVMGNEFEKSVRTALGLSSKDPFEPSKLQIKYSLRIYTNLGSFVVGTSADVRGDDPRFNNNAARMFLRWNLMDGHRRRVGVGAYIASYVVQVTYDGRSVFQNESNSGYATQIFGVQRR